MFRRQLVSLAIAALLYQLFFVTVTFAADATNCAESSVFNRWSGQGINGGYHGSSGTAQGQDLHVCLNPNGIERDGTFYFSNVENNTHANNIVQVGMAKCREPGVFCSTSMFYARGWGRSHTTSGCSAKTDIFPTMTPVSLTWNGASRDYKIYHQTNAWRFYIDSNQVYSINELEICWTPNRASWFGESWDSGDAIGGSLGDKLRVSSTNTASTENGGFTFTGFNAAAPCTYGIVTGPYFCDLVNATTLDIWTDR